MEDYSEIGKRVGTLVLNLLSLELCLRLMLNRWKASNGTAVGTPCRLFKLEKGQSVLEDPLADYRNLRELILKCNEELESRSFKERFDNSLVDVRDAIAHGRVTGLPPLPFRIVKFSRPAVRGRIGNSVAKVVFAEQFTEEWLGRQVDRTANEVNKALSLMRQIGVNVETESVRVLPE